ncbi:hypothetical protein V8B55DRAFT_1452029 [Mucor lusitanicus]|uniref:Uncharacterized protein n=1 Tax=Mucor circinelloides f. lusitanicus TaxID=29924 RepID=A0A8H4B9K4_MUCCL|nr:hypothetical protein FB192DRAFT_1439480 [Mucor lusitanicus]
MAFSAIHATSRKRTEPQQDEVEASSILVSLANHHHHSAKKSKTSTPSMSIHNLLESGQQEPPRETQHPATPPAFSNARMQMSPEKYIGHGMHPKAQMTIQHNQKSQFQRPANIDKRSFHPAHQQQGPYNRMPSQHAYYHSPPNSTMDYPKQYSKMKCSPKIRRNALQAYISYMTYTDMRRKRMGKTMHQQNTIPPASSPYNNTLMKPDPYASQYRPPPHQHQQQLASPPYHHQQQHHQPPPPPSPHLYQQKQHHFNPPHDSRMRPSYPPQQQQLLSPPPPSPNQRVSVQTKPSSSSSAASSPLDKRMSSPPASKVIVDQPLTAFLHHNRPLTASNKSPPPPVVVSTSQQQHPCYRSNNVTTPSPIARQYNSAFR